MAVFTPDKFLPINPNLHPLYKPLKAVPRPTGSAIQNHHVHTKSHRRVLVVHYKL